MTNQESKLMARLTSDASIFNGKVIIKGHRLAVEHVLSMLAAGDSVEKIIKAYPQLEYDDIRACFTYARWCVEMQHRAPTTT